MKKRYYVHTPDIGTVEYDPTVTLEQLDASPAYEHCQTNTRPGHLTRTYARPIKCPTFEGYAVYRPAPSGIDILYYFKTA